MMMMLRHFVLLTFAVLFSLLIPSTPPTALAGAVCVATPLSQVGTDVRLVSLTENKDHIAYYDQTSGAVFLQDLPLETLPVQLAGTYPNATRLELLQLGAVVAVLEGQTLHMASRSNPTQVYTLAQTLRSGPFTNNALDQFALVVDTIGLENAPTATVFYGFFIGEFPQRPGFTLDGREDPLFQFEQLAFTNGDTILTGLVRARIPFEDTPLGWTVYAERIDSGSINPIQLNAAVQQPARLNRFGSRDFITVTYTTPQGTLMLESIFPEPNSDPLNRDMTRHLLSENAIRVNQPILLTRDERLIYAERDADGDYVLVRNTPQANDRFVLTDNLSPTCFESTLCSLYTLVNDDVVYRGVADDGTEGFYAISTNAITITATPRLLFSGTNAFVFFGGRNVLVFLEPLRVDGDQVIFSLTRVGLDGSAQEVVSGLRWPVDTDFDTRTVQLADDDTTLTYVSNPGLDINDFRLFRVRLDEPEAFPRRVIETPIDITSGGQPYWVGPNAEQLYTLTVNADATRTLTQVACGIE